MGSSARWHGDVPCEGCRLITVSLPAIGSAENALTAPVAAPLKSLISLTAKTSRRGPSIARNDGFTASAASPSGVNRGAPSTSGSTRYA